MGASPNGNTARYLTFAEIRELRIHIIRHGLLSTCKRFGVGHETLNAAVGGGRVRADTAERILCGIRGAS